MTSVTPYFKGVGGVVTLVTPASLFLSVSQQVPSPFRQSPPDLKQSTPLTSTNQPNHPPTHRCLQGGRPRGVGGCLGSSELFSLAVSELYFHPPTPPTPPPSSSKQAPLGVYLLGWLDWCHERFLGGFWAVSILDCELKRPFVAISKDRRQGAAPRAF